MRVLLNLSTLRGLGSRLVGEGILHAFAQKTGGSHSVIAFIPSDWGNQPELGGQVHLERVTGGLLNKFLTENVRVRQAIAKHDVDVVFSTGDTGTPWAGVPHLLLVQQAFLTRRAVEMDFTRSVGFRTRFALMDAYFRAGLGSMGRITVQTQDMKNHLAQRWGLSDDKVVVVPSALSPDVLASGLSNSSPRVGETKSGPMVSGRYLAYISGAGPHKNHRILADLLWSLPSQHRDIRCALTATPDEVPALWERAVRLGVDHRLVFLGRLSHANAVGVAREASALVIPSQLESFGLPYYEGLALNKPMVVTEAGFSREACGDRALYAPASVGEVWAHQTARALDGWQPPRSEPKELWTWSHAVDAYLQIMQGLLDASPSTTS